MPFTVGSFCGLECHTACESASGLEHRYFDTSVSQLLGLSTGESEKTKSGDLESTAILWIDLDDG